MPQLALLVPALLFAQPVPHVPTDVRAGEGSSAAGILWLLLAVAVAVLAWVALKRGARRNRTGTH